MPGLDITPKLPAGRQLIERYGGGGFTVSGARYEGSVLIVPTVTRLWAVREAAEITLSSLAALATATAGGILVIGCGPTHEPAPPALMQSLRAGGWAVEWMATRTACHTYNVLVLDNREVAAALIAVA